MQTPSQDVAAASLAPSVSKLPRILAALMGLVLSYFFVLEPARELWLNYWLIRDGHQGLGVILKPHWGGHDVFVYQYVVNQKTYTGQDFRSYQNPKYAKAAVGEETVVYFSASHPWLSAMNLPRAVIFEGLPVVLLAWVFIFFFAATAINPKNRWALRQQPGRR